MTNKESKELDAAMRAAVEKLLIENCVWEFNAFGWQNAYDADPKFIGHAMWQVEPAIDFTFNTNNAKYPSSTEQWKRELSISGADFEGLMRAARNSIGLLLFQIEIRPDSFLPEEELFDLHRMGSLIYLATATDRLRLFFILAAFRQKEKTYRARGKKFKTAKRTDYLTPFIEAQNLFQNSSTKILGPINSLVPLVHEICAIRNDRNKLDYEGTGPKAPHGDITYKGVTLSSRYDVKSEFDEMKRVIDSMPELMARRIDSIWCDSKACACFIVQIRPLFFVEDIPFEIEDAFKNTLHGYNGLSIECEGRKIPYRDCYWPADEAGFEDGDNMSEEDEKIEF